MLPACLAALVLAQGCIEGQREIGMEVIEEKVVTEAAGASIADILAARKDYLGREVTVSGKVLPGLAFEFVSEQPYRIIQEETVLWVITEDVAPTEGAFVTVRGRIASPYQIKGRSYDLVLLEEERQ
ncbi:MAG: hypothetical protein Kow0089_22800 [Desulfobulbaceae bacterium]